MAVDIGFWVLAVIGIAAALTVVLLRDVFRAALALVLCFLMVAGIYITLSADFLAAVQVLVYIGGISVLIILAIMLTRELQRGSPANKLVIPAFIVAVLFFGVVAFAVVLEHYLILSAILFSIGLYGALAKRNAVIILMSIEIMLNAVNIAMVAFSRYVVPSMLTGQVFAIFIMVVAAAEAAVGLAIVIAIYRSRETIEATKIDLMKW